jgi:UDPglucose 6-dehydrogenase
MKRLIAAGAVVRAYDPEAMEGARALFGDQAEFVSSPYLALEDAHALAIVTEWNEFRRPNFAKMRQLMSTPAIFDGRNIYTPSELRKHGFTYVCIGSPGVKKEGAE